MIRFVLVSLFRAMVTIMAVVTFAFVVLRMSGDPAMVMLGPDVPREAVDAFRKALGLDQPLWIQYRAY
ncbi:ABC transporter permease, partial [Corallococcus sp. AB050B]